MICRQILASISSVKCSSAESTDEAVRLSVLHMHDLLQQETGLAGDEALMLMSAVGQARISQVVNALKTARFCMPLKILRDFRL